MRYNMLTLKFSSSLGTFDTTPLDDFQRNRNITDLRQQFFRVGRMPHLLCVLEWEEAPAQTRPQSSTSKPATTSAPSNGERRRSKPDPTAGLDEKDRVLFQTVRRWRMERSRSEGVAPYVILTDRLLRTLLAKKPENLTALSQIDGIGKAKVERYGEDLLRLLHGAPEPKQAGA